MSYEVLNDIFINKIGLNENHYKEFLHIGHTKTLAKKDILVKAGSVCTSIAFINSGVMRSFVSGNGEEHNTDFYFDNHFVSAYSSVITQLPSEHSIQALTETSLIWITLEEYRKLVTTDLEWLKFGKYLAEFFLVRKCKREISFLKQTAWERMEDMLLSYPGIEQMVSQYHIASYLGIKPESLSRIKLTELILNKS